MQYVLTKFRIRFGKVDQTRTFLKSLNKRKTEMRKVLAESHVNLDCSFIDSNSDGDFVYIFKRLANVDKLKKNIELSSLPIYDEIREWAASCLDEGRIDLESVASFEYDLD